MELPTPLPLINDQPVVNLWFIVKQSKSHLSEYSKYYASIEVFADLDEARSRFTELLRENDRITGYSLVLTSQQVILALRLS